MVCGGNRNSASALVWKLMEKKQWSALSLLLRDKQARLSVYKRRHVNELNAKIPMLSYALIMGAPQVIVEEFLQAYPESIEVADNLGRLPLHLACIQSRSVAVIDMLLNYNETHVLISDCHGNLPLHYAVKAACQSKKMLDEDMDVLSSLLVTCPHSAMMCNRAGDTPVTLSRRLDKHSLRRIHRMLASSNKTLNGESRGSLLIRSDEFTAPSSSIFMEAEAASAFFEAEKDDIDIGWDDSERQAFGERPKRRNGIVITLPISFQA